MYHFAICSPPLPLFLPSFGLFRLITCLFTLIPILLFQAKLFVMLFQWLHQDFFKPLFFAKFQGHNKTEEKNIDFPFTPIPPRHSLPTTNIPHLCGALATTDQPVITPQSSSKVHCLRYSSSVVVYIRYVGLDKYIMTCVYPHGITQAFSLP